jgi:type IV pilus biogenesis protein CpaD/CtpE
VNRPTRLLLVAAALLSGCASFTENDCRTANWHYLGEQDARTHGLQPQIDQIVHQCAKFGVQVPEEDYLRGWRDGEQRRALSRG